MKCPYILLKSMLLAFLVTACAPLQSDGRLTIEQSGESITVLEETETSAGTPSIAVVALTAYPGVEMSDWLDDNTLILSKENHALEKLTLAESGEAYPTSLFTHSLEGNTYSLLKAQPGTNLMNAILSPNKKSLLYTDYTVGDPLYHVMDLASGKSFPLRSEAIADAMSAHWSSDNTILGASYTGGAYTATAEGKIDVLEEFTDKAPVVLEKIGEAVYYTSSDDETLRRLEADNTSTSLALPGVYAVAASPDEKKLLVLQGEGGQMVLSLYDPASAVQTRLASGVQVSAMSWSADQRFIAYSLKSDQNGRVQSALYVYDLLTQTSQMIAVDVEALHTRWSPSGEKLLFVQYDGSHFHSSIAEFEYALTR